MHEFLSAIPAAAVSPYAFGAYAICAAVFLLVGSKLRSVQTVLRSIATVPAADRRHVIEAVTGSVIPESISADEWIRSNRNRWLFLLAATALILLSAVAIIAAVNPSGPGPAPPAIQARAVALEWLRVFDSQRFADAYAEMYEGFRGHTSEAEWLKLSATYRAPLGTVESRLDASMTPAEFNLGRPLNGYGVMFYTKFSKLPSPIREVVSLASPGAPEPWRVAGYNVEVPPDSPVLADAAGKDAEQGHQ